MYSEFENDIETLSPYERQLEQLKEWPHTVHRVSETLDPTLIESQGKQLIYQALRNRNIAAFTGSGLSITYGRLSWSGWQKRQTGAIQKYGIAFVDCSSSSLTWIEAQNTILKLLKSIVKNSELELSAVLTKSDGVHKKISDLIKEWIVDSNVETWKFSELENLLRLKSTEIKFKRNEIKSLSDTHTSLLTPGDFPGDDGMPIIFECASQLHNAVTQAVKIFADSSKEYTISPAEKLLSDNIKESRPGFNCSFDLSNIPESLADNLKSIYQLIIDLNKEVAGLKLTISNSTDEEAKLFYTCLLYTSDAADE